VRVDGVEIPRDRQHLNGWDHVDATKMSVEIYGPACEALSSGQPHTVTVFWKCGAIT